MTAYSALTPLKARCVCVESPENVSSQHTCGLAVVPLRHNQRDSAEAAHHEGYAMTGMASRLCEPLAPHAEKIAGSADRQSVRYVPSTWRSWLTRGDVSPDVTDRVFSAIGPETVARSHIRTLARHVDSADGRLALLIATLVRGRGTTNGRMRDAIVRALTHQDRDQVLKQTAELAQRGAVADAYAAWRLPGLRAPFFTKWLWAASSLTPQSCCLIRTSRYGKASARLAGTATLRRGDGTGHRAMRHTSLMFMSARAGSATVSAPRTSNTSCSGSTATSTTCKGGPDPCQNSNQDDTA